jgi:hypothetical protein
MVHSKTGRAGLAAALAAALGVSLASCGGTAGAALGTGAGAVTSPAAVSVVHQAAVSVAAGAPVTEVAAAAPTAGALTAGEIEGVYWMREEEKLARDVYLAMFDLWGLPTFENIAASESRHMEAVLGLIEGYGLDDPVVDAAPGVFSDPQLSALYGELVERGSQSLVEALTVGALIEDLDIRDLEEALAVTDRADIERVYESLLRGSTNHLRAFTSRLEAEGVEYEAVYHTEAELAALLAAPSGGWRGLRRGGGR